MKLPILFILFTVMLDAIGIGIILPVTPQLLQSIQHSSFSDAAIWGGIMAFSFALMQFLFGPMIGNLSDRFGRRPIMLTSLFVMALDYLLLGLAHSLLMLIIARIIGGITGATHATAMAYMADISKQDQKAKNFGLIWAAFGLGFVLGPLLGGVLAEFGIRVPFYVAAIVAFSNFMFGYIVLKETVPVRMRRRFVFWRSSPFSIMMKMRDIPYLQKNMLVFFFYSIAFNVYPIIWAFYMFERFAWQPLTIGLSLAIFGLLGAITQGALLGRIITKFGEIKTVAYGMIIGAIALLGYAFAPSEIFIFLLLPLTAVGVMAGPALQALMSKLVAGNEQGELQGALTSVSALALIISPLIMTQVFWLFTVNPEKVYFPGAPFVLSALLIMVALWLFTRRGPRPSLRGL